MRQLLKYMQARKPKPVPIAVVNDAHGVTLKLARWLKLPDDVRKATLVLEAMEAPTVTVEQYVTGTDTSIERQYVITQLVPKSAV
jgi:hypothetical protein